MDVPFKPRQRVRLVRDVLPVASGSEGVVIGYHKCDPPTFVLAFEEGLLSDLSADDLVASEDVDPGAAG